MRTIVYAHGFKSSSRSRKCRQLGEYLAEQQIDIHYHTPDLNFDPQVALQQLESLCAAVDPDALTVVGSSLGGFYALVLAEKFGCRAALLNPSIRPFDTLAHYLGRQTNLYTGEAFDFTTAHIDFLRAQFVATPTRPERYLLIVETGDEVLDYRDATTCYAGAQQIVVERGDHELKSFPQHIPALLAFAGIKS